MGSESRAKRARRNVRANIGDSVEASIRLARMARKGAKTAAWMRRATRLGLRMSRSWGLNPEE